VVAILEDAKNRLEIGRKLLTGQPSLQYTARLHSP
jgi:hypothetical protein